MDYSLEYRVIAKSDLSTGLRSISNPGFSFPKTGSQSHLEIKD